MRDFAKGISLAKNDGIDACRIAYFAATVPGEPLERKMARAPFDEMTMARPFLRPQLDGARNHARQPLVPTVRQHMVAHIKAIRTLEEDNGRILSEDG